MKKLSLILLLCLTSSVLFSQNQVLIKQNGGASWQEAMGGGANANVRAIRTTNQSIPIATNTTVTFSSEDYDVKNSFDPSTGIFTPSEAGYYVIMASVNWNNTAATSLILQLRRNSSRIEQNNEKGGGATHSSLHTLIHSDGTNNYSVFAWQSSGAATNVTICDLTIYKLPDPNEEHMTKVNGGVSWKKSNSSNSLVKAKRTSNLSIPSGTITTIIYSSEDYDLNSEFNPSTDVFTPSEAGYYEIMATPNWNIGSSSSGRRRIRLIKQDGSVLLSLSQKSNEESSSGGDMTSSLHTVIYYDGTSGQDLSCRGFSKFRVKH